MRLLRARPAGRAECRRPDTAPVLTVADTVRRTFRRRVHVRWTTIAARVPSAPVTFRRSRVETRLVTGGLHDRFEPGPGSGTRRPWRRRVPPHAPALPIRIGSLDVSQSVDERLRATLVEQIEEARPVH
jgi:hypothetical protein